MAEKKKDADIIKKKKIARKQQRKTFGQNVQKFNTVIKEEKKSNFFEGTSDFLEQSEKDNKKSSLKKDYHYRDTYRPSQNKEIHWKKKKEKEHQRKEPLEERGTFGRKESVFTEDKEATFVNMESDECSKNKNLKRKQVQAEKARRKVEKARKKLPKKQKYILQREFDEDTGKKKYRIASIEQEKTFKDAEVVKTATQWVGNKASSFVHGKIAEVEKENSAVEGAHKVEQRVEDLWGFVKQQYRNKAQRQRAKVAKLEKRQFQKEVNFQYQKFLEENPQVQKKILQKRLQKQKIKRAYIKAKRKAAATKNTEEAITKSANLAVTATKKLKEITRKHIRLFVTIGIVMLFLVMVISSISSCGAIFSSMQSTILAASYLSKPKEIDAADLQLTRLELYLQNEIDHIEADYPGYDEYSYNLGEIGHSPFTLINYLSAVYSEFTASEVEHEIKALFEEMYTLTLTPDTETRTRTITDAETGEKTEEVYEVSILRVTLKSKSLEMLVTGKMNPEQTEVYQMYGESKGLLQEFVSPLNLYWYYYVSSFYGYRKNTSTGVEELHRGVDIAVPEGTVVYAGHDGIVTNATYDNNYGNYVVIEKDNYTTKYAHMERLSVYVGQDVRKGMEIGKTGSHLHMECLYNGEYYNPLFYFATGTDTLYGEVAGGTVGNVVPPDAYDDAAVQALMEEAAKYLGFPYVWGGSKPSTSFDCSGFVCWVFTNSGVHKLPRTTVQGIYNQCTPISIIEARAGDIIFFTGTYNSSGPVSHVGIYCGNGVFIHCGDPISYASVNSSYWQSHFYGYGRLN